MPGPDAPKQRIDRHATFSDSLRFLKSDLMARCFGTLKIDPTLSTVFEKPVSNDQPAVHAAGKRSFVFLMEASVLPVHLHPIFIRLFDVLPDFCGKFIAELLIII